MIELLRLKPTYMSESDIPGSDIFLKDGLIYSLQFVALTDMASESLYIYPLEV